MKSCPNPKCTSVHADDYFGTCQGCGGPAARTSTEDKERLTARWLSTPAGSDSNAPQTAPPQRVAAVRKLLFGEEDAA